MSKKIIALTIFSVILSACAGFLVQEPDWIQTGPQFSANHGAVDLYSNPEDVKKPYGVLGMARMKGVPKNTKDIKNAIEEMRKFASTKGATGLLVNQEPEGENGEAGTVMVAGYAIKYKDSVTPADQKAIDDFKLIGAVDTYKK